jgi:hypothetical protein
MSDSIFLIGDDRAPVYPRVLEELVPSALHTVEQTPIIRSRQIMGG